MKTSGFSVGSLGVLLRGLRKSGALAGLLIVLPGVARGQTTYTPYAFTTLAGVPASPSYADGVGDAARFDTPNSVAVDIWGNVYVADYLNYVIRKITPAGAVTTLAGLAGVYGYADGQGTAARFRSRVNVAADAAGNVYVADWTTHVIRKITLAGEVTTLAGSPTLSGSEDGQGSAARFNLPEGIAVDGAGNLYVADLGNRTIRKVTPTGAVTTLAGSAGDEGSADGQGNAARFAYPNGIAVDGAGNVYVADSVNRTIRKVTANGAVTTLAGQAGAQGFEDGTGSAARFEFPSGVAADNVYVTDNCTIRRITPAGVVTTWVGVHRVDVVITSDADVAGQADGQTYADGPGSAARLYYPQGVAADGLGNIYVADTGNHAIRKVTATAVVTTLAGLPASVTNGSADGQGSAARFANPASIAADRAENAYVAEPGSHTIRKITSTGLVTTLAGLAGFRGYGDGMGSAARFDVPQGVAVDGAGNVYVADTGNHTIRQITPGGVVMTLAGRATFNGYSDGQGGTARFGGPHGVAVDGAGNVYVADSANHLIRKITTGGVVTTLAGLAKAYGSTDGPDSSARFNSPEGVAVDGTGNVYVADTGNQTIRKITAGGDVTTLAGLAGAYGSTDDQGAAARFSFPEQVAVDGVGNVYVAERLNHTVRKVTPTGVVTTLGGLPGSYGVTDGMGSSARFNGPRGVAVDNSGKIYVADTDNALIRTGVLPVAPTILTQPQSQTAMVGGSVRFSVTAADQPTPTYQWYCNGGAINGATGDTLRLTNVQPSDAASYVVVVSNDVGNVTSHAATLTVSLAGATSSGSGGGTTEAWFALALVLLGVSRMRARAKTG